MTTPLSNLKNTKALFTLLLGMVLLLLVVVAIVVFVFVFFFFFFLILKKPKINVVVTACIHSTIVFSSTTFKSYFSIISNIIKFNCFLCITSCTKYIILYFIKLCNVLCSSSTISTNSNIIIITKSYFLIFPSITIV